jgi:hypothetical protein
VLAAVGEAYTRLARRRPALYDAMFTHIVPLPFATAEASAALWEAFGELARAVEPVAAEGDDPGLRTETYWASLHGLVTLTRSGRLPEEAHERRLALLRAFRGGGRLTAGHQWRLPAGGPAWRLSAGGNSVATTGRATCVAATGRRELRSGYRPGDLRGGYRPGNPVATAGRSGPRGGWQRASPAAHGGASPAAYGGMSVAMTGWGAETGAAGQTGGPGRRPNR